MRRREFVVLLGGVTAVWPLAALAQQPGMPVIGFLSSRSPDESKRVLAAFHQGLSEAGFIEGTNIAIEYRWAFGEYEKLPALATDLVNRNVVVIARRSEVTFPQEQQSMQHQQFLSSLVPPAMQSKLDWSKA